MKAIILAAGQGARLKKYTKNLPKGMLEFCGKTIIRRQIDLYKSIGVKDIIVVRGFAAEKISYTDVTYYDNADYATTNMVESLMKAKNEFDSAVIVSYSDILFSRDMLKGMMQEDGDFVVAVDDNWEKYWLTRYGTIDFDTESLEIDTNNHIKSLGLDAPDVNSIDARYIGLLKFSKAGLDILTSIWERDYSLYQDKPWMLSGKCIRQAYMTDLLMALIKDQYAVKASHYNNGWIEFDTNEDYERMCELLDKGVIHELIELE
jgi:choline kinase